MAADTSHYFSDLHFRKTENGMLVCKIIFSDGYKPRWLPRRYTNN